MSPRDVGLEGGGRRRTPGLRREEVAQLAGVSVSWYTWLEQGRDMRPSPSVLDAIARVLALSAAERAHLFQLARVELPLRWLLLDRLPAEPRYEPTAKNTLARFRAAHARYIDHPDFAALVAELEERSPQFRAWWPRHDVLADQAGTKSVDHWRAGPLRLHHLQTVPTSHPDLRLTIYAPADEASRAALVDFVAEVGA